MTENKNQENNHEEEVKKLTSKIIELQDLIIARDNLIIDKEKEVNSAKEKGMSYYLKLTNECSDKNDKIHELKSEILKMKAVMAREWRIPLEKAEERLKDLQKELAI